MMIKNAIPVNKYRIMQISASNLKNTCQHEHKISGIIHSTNIRHELHQRYLTYDLLASRTVINKFKLFRKNFSSFLSVVLPWYGRTTDKLSLRYICCCFFSFVYLSRPTFRVHPSLPPDGILLPGNYILSLAIPFLPVSFDCVLLHPTSWNLLLWVYLSKKIQLESRLQFISWLKNYACIIPFP